MVEEIFDMTRRFVRVLDVMPSGLIEFEFAIGNPDFVVEMVMPQAAFKEFCDVQQVEILEKTPDISGQSAQAEFNWGMRQATHKRFR